MKELSIEEKARAYDKVLAIAKEQLNGAKVFDYDNEQVAHDIRTTVYNIFPELKESEDEQIRKEDEDVRKWLISQLETKSDVNNSCELELMILKSIVWLKKQGEKNPAEWHIEDEQNLNACLGYIPDELLRRWLKDVIHAKYDKPINKLKAKFHKERKDERISWLNSLEDRFNNQESNKDHWQEVRERAAIAAMQGYMSCKCQLVGTINLAMAEGIAEQAILIADVLVKKLKGE